MGGGGGMRESVNGKGLNVTRRGDVEVEDIKICMGSSGMSCSDGRKSRKKYCGISCRS